MSDDTSKQPQVATSTTNENFTHEPLNRDEQSIRVIKLQKGTRKGDVHCDLKHIDIEDNTYVCLSYVWGEPEPTCKIYINGKSFQVRQNLYNFLIRARKFRKQEWLWIDAICIDQTDNDERGHQVRLMALIYSRAKHVLVYPGEVPKTVNLVYYIVRITRWMVDGGAVSNQILEILRIFLCFGPLLVMAALDEMMQPIYRKKLEQFHDLEYWQRVWIIQELMLSKQLYLVTKPSNLHIDDGMASWNIAKPGTFLNSVLKRRSSEPHGGQKLDELLRAFDRSKSSLQVDRIYALLGLVRIPGDFKIDYRRPIHAVVFDVVERFWASVTKTIPGLFMHAVFSALNFWPAVLCCQCSHGHIPNVEENGDAEPGKHSCEPLHSQEAHQLWFTFLGKRSRDEAKTEALLDTFTTFNSGGGVVRWENLPDCDVCGQCLEKSFTQRKGGELPSVRLRYIARPDDNCLVLKLVVENAYNSEGESSEGHDHSGGFCGQGNDF